MQRINTTSKATDLFGVGKHGYKAGNPMTGDPATSMSPDALNALQEEIARTIEGTGMALDPANNSQLLAAIRSMITNRNFSGLVRSMTPIGGALVREWADIANAATVGGIEIGYSYNVAIDPATGAWLGRDIADICWLQKWHDTAGTFEIWSAATDVAGIAPVWNQTFSFNSKTGALTIFGAITAAQATIPGHLVTLGQAEARYAPSAGSSSQIFQVKNGAAPNDAVNVSQALFIRTADQTPVLTGAGSTYTANHSLGYPPFYAQLEFKCLAAEQNYAIGDVVDIGAVLGAYASPLPSWKTSTAVGATISTGAGTTLQMYNKTTGVAFNPTPANWAYRFVLR